MSSRPSRAHPNPLLPSRWPLIARVALVALLALIAGVQLAARVT
ncbi:hypothetical protein [Nocardioides islandensis]|nr:hypothetical protein [Nocardioides islandensis]